MSGYGALDDGAAKLRVPDDANPYGGGGGGNGTKHKHDDRGHRGSTHEAHSIGAALKRKEGETRCHYFLDMITLAKHFEYMIMKLTSDETKERMYTARHDSADHFSRLDALLFNSHCPDFHSRVLLCSMTG